MRLSADRSDRHDHREDLRARHEGDDTVTIGGRERSKDEAKGAAEAAYRRICEIPGASAENLKRRAG